MMQWSSIFTLESMRQFFFKDILTRYGYSTADKCMLVVFNTMLCLTACSPSILVVPWADGGWHRCRAQIIVSPTTAQTRLPLFKLWNRNCKSSCEQSWWRYVDLITNNNHILQTHIECWSMTSIHRCFPSCTRDTRSTEKQIVLILVNLISLAIEAELPNPAVSPVEA